MIDKFFMYLRHEKALLLLDLRAVYDIIKYSNIICFNTNNNLKFDYYSKALHIALRLTFPLNISVS